MKVISTGIDVLKSQPKKYLGPKGKRKVAGLCHPSSVTKDFTHLVQILEENSNLVALFGPQHGIHGETQDNMIEWQDTKDQTGRPIYSLYGERRRPTLDSLNGVDQVVIDLFDVGSRYYTFIYTMAYMLEACGKLKIPVTICDRPNPLGGEYIEGPILDLDYRSFVGLYPMPVCHGMTVGELAKFFCDRIAEKPQIEIIPMKGWKRSMTWEKTGLTWTLPSPNMPAYETARLYPGMCLLEATSLSEGRGTTRPFELIGAPFIDWTVIEREYIRICKELRLAPVAFHRQGFIPTFHKFSGQMCHGALQYAPAKNFRPLRHMAILFWLLKKLYRKEWQWKDPPYEYEYHKLPIDILAGGEKLRHTIDQGLPLKELFQEWKLDEERFKKIRQPFLMYR